MNKVMIWTALLGLLEKIQDDQYTPEIKAILKEQIESAAVDLTPNPRDGTEGNLKLLNAAMLIAFGTAQDLYGVGDDTSIYKFPLFKAQPQSQIAPLLGDHGTVAIVLGLHVGSWEDVFYDICHESLHLLNPVINVKGNEVRVSALEEGVAVKFAEEMYEKYIKPHCDRIPSTSPMNACASQYFLAYSAAKKIPDNVLKKIRNVFGKFSNIDDIEKFKELAGNFISQPEVDFLANPFIYK